MQTIIDHIYEIYEPLRQALQTHGTLKAEIKIIPVVISRTGTFHIKTLAKIAQLVSFTEEPPDELTFKPLPLTAIRNRNGTPRTCTGMAILHIQNLKKDLHHKDKKDRNH